MCCIMEQYSEYWLGAQGSIFISQCFTNKLCHTLVCLGLVFFFVWGLVFLFGFLFGWLGWFGLVLKHPSHSLNIDSVSFFFQSTVFLI